MLFCKRNLNVLIQAIPDYSNSLNLNGDLICKALCQTFLRLKINAKIQFVFDRSKTKMIGIH